MRPKEYSLKILNIEDYIEHQHGYELSIGLNDVRKIKPKCYVYQDDLLINQLLGKTLELFPLSSLLACQWETHHRSAS